MGRVGRRVEMVDSERELWRDVVELGKEVEILKVDEVDVVVEKGKGGGGGGGGKGCDVRPCATSKVQELWFVFLSGRDGEEKVKEVMEGMWEGGPREVEEEEEEDESFLSPPEVFDIIREHAVFPASPSGLLPVVLLHVAPLALLEVSVFFC